MSLSKLNECLFGTISVVDSAVKFFNLIKSDIHSQLIGLEKLSNYLTVRNGLKVFGFSFFTALAYYTLKVYLVRRKYAHIPGPETKGLEIFNFFFFCF